MAPREEQNHFNGQSADDEDEVERISNLRDLQILEKDLSRCLDAVDVLKGFQAAEAHVEQVIDVTQSVTDGITKASRDYARALRKHVATEAYKLSYLLRQLRKFETNEQFINRRHGQLYDALKEYHQVHLSI